MSNHQNINIKTSLVLCVFANQLVAYLLIPDKSPELVLVQGQDYLPISTSQSLVMGCADVAERLKGDGVDLALVHYLADFEGRRLLLDGQSHPGFPEWPIWQLFAWEWLSTRFGLGSFAVNDCLTWLKNELAPWLLTVDSAIERQQMQAILVREYQDESARLAAERLQLQRENEALRAQNAALQQIDAEHLLRFLPALFPRIFTVIGAADLALLSGRVEPLQIPNPYPEPSEETLRILQRNFCALPSRLQQQIVNFVANLPLRNKLQVRPEMRELFSELEGN